MGHERLGVLPKSRSWRVVVSELSEYTEIEGDISGIAKNTIRNVRTRFQHIQDDEGVKAAISFIIDLALSARENRLSEKLQKNPTPLAIARAANEVISSQKQSPEYSQIASAAVATAVAKWYQKYNTGQEQMFRTGSESEEVWSKAGSGAGFSDLARFFFANFTERYLNYFLEREASGAIQNISDRNDFSEKIAKHAFETSKVVQSFSAGWFNKNAKGLKPSKQDINGFLSFAFGKIRDELLREERSQ